MNFVVSDMEKVSTINEYWLRKAANQSRVFLLLYGTDSLIPSEDRTF